MEGKNTAYIEQSVEINAPVEEVFRYAADWENWPRFFKGMYDFGPTSENTRGTGERYAYKAEMPGMKDAAETEICDFVENRGWREASTNDIERQTSWTFEEVDGKTKLTYGLGYAVPVPTLDGLLDDRFVEPAWERIIRNALQNLKDQTE
jgi:uncharacterized membrane protein